ncbi:3-hydroxybutyryl-CoA dehydrogenase [Nocardia mangyaensis]|uniref:3-hydroxybutyryl-CoA dehydrogenase n=1 Tax=Nocardia mangyaensis TaxID=2213200 RepID=A0A1J0W0V4_9NOCA|nr:3-hydroxyacyl-CoA dehydrogenase NAD-binding domain-containing protein [Nocardia mangyaensis]APE37823.1 3-hydroxybutyryl-CoA dehydrogenase [Nocardia mangyaensis]
MSSVPQNHRQRPVTVIGAGTLGRRIALMFATRGGTVRITDPHAETGAAAVAFVREQLPAVAAQVTDGSPGAVEYESDQATAVAGAWLVVEAVPEILDLKKQIFAQLDTQADADAIVSSNSSSYASRLFTEGLRTRDRMLNTHFYMPPQSTVLDVMSDGETRQDVLDFVLETLPEYGLHPFLCREESTGFIFNRIWAAIKREALEVVYEGVSIPEDVDEMFALNFGTKAGPFRMMDQVGLDVVLDIEDHYAKENPNLPDGPRALLHRYVDAGKLGVKTGEGFYDDYPKPK